MPNLYKPIMIHTKMAVQRSYLKIIQEIIYNTELMAGDKGSDGIEKAFSFAESQTRGVQGFRF